jgi:PilZ domain
MGATDISTANTKILSNNRRRGLRHRLDVPAVLVSDAGQFSVHFTELSVAGAGLKSSVALQVGDVYEVRAFDSLLPLGTRVKIVSRRDGNAGGFQIGAEVL